MTAKNKADVLVIGGGVIGICVAHYLSQAGVKVCMLEKGEIGNACSSQNAGLVVPSHVIPLAAPGVVAKGLRWMFNPESPFYIKPRFDLHLLAWLWAFLKASSKKQMQQSLPVLHELLQTSYKLFESLAQQFDFGFTQNGLLMLCATEKGLEEEAKHAETARQVGLKVAVLNAHEVQKLEPNIKIQTKGGVYYRQDAHLDPALFVRTVSDSLNRGTVAIHDKTEVIDFKFLNGKIIGAVTVDQEFFADNFVIAGGSWTPAIAGKLRIRVPIQAGKGYSVTLSGLNARPKIPFILSEAKIAVTPMGNALRFAGTMELSGIDLSINQRRTKAMLNQVPKYLPEINLEQLRRLPHWSGLRPCTPDGLPIIGRDSRFENLLFATGHAMLGMSLAPITGVLLTELLTKKQTSLNLMPLRVNRF